MLVIRVPVYHQQVGRVCVGVGRLCYLFVIIPQGSLGICVHPSVFVLGVGGEAIADVGT